ncbi:glyoxylate reductase/hydroxypyruvate reductase isoform X2 [Manduca sexta]|uniref:glyoxylate reductase/hydroxypyruvate reductase isoform X2 n=1 Tax=Manduca sexta TaxID=7130 RepID=UPI00188F8103|nr:glyoxylate reductase/hydroxypyruvate reductase isoform X2 [Manduca sexta]
MSFQVYIADKRYPAVGLDLLRKTTQTTFLTYLEYGEDSLKEIKNNIKGCDGLIWNTHHPLTAEILDLAGPQLKVISSTSTGFDHIDLGEVKKRGIPLGYARLVLNNSVADVAVGLMIAAARRFKEGVINTESGNWELGAQWRLGQDITGSTVGIVGLGSIGQAVVRRLKGFDVAKFLYCGRREKPEAKTLGVQRVSLEQLLAESDYVILACPLTDETKELINANTLKMMKKTAVLVNIARGGLVEQDALYEALKENRIFAAGLDVVTPEPIPKDHKILSLPNCFVTPHMGGATMSNLNTKAIIAAKNILLGLEGKPLLYPVI